MPPWRSVAEGHWLTIFAAINRESAGVGGRMNWARILAFVTGMVDQELLVRIEYLAAHICDVYELSYILARDVFEIFDHPSIAPGPLCCYDRASITHMRRRYIVRQVKLYPDVDH
jgi:hypothetical protein